MCVYFPCREVRIIVARQETKFIARGDESRPDAAAAQTTE